MQDTDVKEKPRRFAWIRVRLSSLGGNNNAKATNTNKRPQFTTASVAANTMTMSDCVLSATPPPISVNKVETKPLSDVLAGALARAASQSTIHPLDTMKVRLQTGLAVFAMPVSKFGQLVPPPGGGAFNPAELGKGVSGLYRGVVGAASGAGIAIGAYFAVYGAASNMISQYTDLSTPAVAFVSGAIAAAGSSVVKVPLAVCIRSVQAGVYPNFLSAAKSIVEKAGPRGLFTGYFPTLLEDVPDMAFKFAAYETLRNVHKAVSNGKAPDIHEDFCMGAVSGALAAAATTPLDVIKTNMMCTAASRPTMVQAAQAVYATGGLSAFFRGIGPRAVSNGINSAVFFCFFEALRGTFAKQSEKEQEDIVSVDARWLLEEKPLVVEVA